MNAVHAWTGSVCNATPSRWRRVPWRLARLVVSMLATRLRRVVAYRDLLSLDAHMLRGLGLSHRAAAESPCERPYDRFTR